MMAAGVEHAAIALLGHLADSAVRALALAAIAGLGLFLLRVRSAAITVGVWTTVLGWALLMPVMGQFAPARWSLTIALPPNPVAQIESSGNRLPAPTSRNAVATTQPTEAVSRDLSIGVPPAPPRRSSASRPVWPGILFIVYLAGFGWLVARMIAGWLITTGFERHATAVSDSAALARLHAYKACVGLKHAPRLLEATDLAAPATTAVFKPAIILPSDWRDWTTAKLDAVLVHELSHVARRDALTRRLSLFYRAIYWFSPLSWWLHRRLVELGEQVSDDATLATGVDRVAYAEALLEFFAAVRRAPRLPHWHVAMASGASAERRVERILSWREGRPTRLTRRVALAIVLGVGPVAVVSASARAALVPTELSMLPGAPERSSSVSSRQMTPVLTWSERSTTPSKDQQASPTPLPQTQSVYLGPPGRDDLASRQMVDFVFDLRTLPGDDIRHATATASMYLNKMWTRADAGLDVFHVGAVHVLNSTLVTVQDFTWERAALEAALADVARAPGGVSSNIRLKTMSAWCGGLDALQPNARMFQGSGIPREFTRLVPGKAMLYFGNGVMRGLDTLSEITAIASACTAPTLQFFSINAATFTDVPVGFSIETVQNQAGSPVTLSPIRLTAGAGDRFSIAIWNGSTKAITSVTLNALARPNDPSLPSPQLLTILGRPLVGQLLPRAVWSTYWSPLEAETASTMAILGARVQIGVVDVQFADGSRWSYDLKGKRSFDVGGGQTVGTMLFPPSMSQLIERAAQNGRVDLLRGVFDAADIPAEDPFAAGAHRLTEASLQAPNPTQPLILGADRTKPVRIVLIDAVIDATGHALRVRTALSVDDSPGGIDQRALVLVRDATFTPAHFASSRFNGEAVTVLVRVPVLVYY